MRGPDTSSPYLSINYKSPARIEKSRVQSWIFISTDLEENYYSGGCVVISAVGVNQAHEVHQRRKEWPDISKLLDLQILTNKTLY